MTLPRSLAFTLAFALPLLLVTAAPTRGARAADSDESAPFSGKPPAAGAFAPSSAPGAGLGTVGQWVVAVQSSNEGSEAIQLRKSGGGGWGLHLRPALDTFIVSNVSVGGVVGFGYGGGSSTASPGSSTFEVGARAGYAFAIADRIAVWPTGGVYLSYTTGNHMSSTNTYLGIFAPFLYLPAPHFFLGIGPTFNLGLSGGGGQDFGLDFAIGGWI
jgi:hypothetical protein